MPATQQIDYHTQQARSFAKEQKEIQTKAWEKGYKSRLANLRAPCPYKEGTKEEGQWLDGWNEADADQF